MRLPACLTTSERASDTMGTAMKPDQKWIDQGQDIYGYLRNSFNHDDAIARMIVGHPDATDWIMEYERVWEGRYRHA